MSSSSGKRYVSIKDEKAKARVLYRAPHMLELNEDLIAACLENLQLGIYPSHISPHERMLGFINGHFFILSSLSAYLTLFTSLYSPLHLKPYME